MSEVKPCDVADMFYPKKADVLSEMISKFIGEAKDFDFKPKALVVPHAGYIYSGPVAGTAYKLLEKYKDDFDNIVILSPSHYMAFRGVAVHSADFFHTPLGDLEVNKTLIGQLMRFLHVNVVDEAFQREHALEVQLPFLRHISDHFKIIPCVVGESTEVEVSYIFNKLWDDPRTLFIVSSDLSHFHDYKTCQHIDGRTKEILEELSWEELPHESACGFFPLRGLLKVTKERGLHLTTLDIRNSGDTQGDLSRVVGYGSFAIH